MWHNLYKDSQNSGEEIESVVSHGMNAHRANNMNIVSFMMICSNYYCFKNKPPQNIDQNHHSPVICQEKKEETPITYLLGLLENINFPLTTYMQIYNKGDIVEIKRMGTVQKGTALLKPVWLNG